MLTNGIAVSKMSVQDVSMVSTLMLGEMRDVHNLEQELVETGEALSLQEHKFEQEVENLQKLQHQKSKLERNILDLIVMTDLERVKIGQLLSQHKKTVEAMNLFESISAFEEERNCMCRRIDALNDQVVELESTLDDLLEKSHPQHFENYKTQVAKRKELEKEAQELEISLNSWISNEESCVAGNLVLQAKLHSAEKEYEERLLCSVRLDGDIDLAAIRFDRLAKEMESLQQDALASLSAAKERHKSSVLFGISLRVDIDGHTSIKTDMLNVFDSLISQAIALEQSLSDMEKKKGFCFVNIQSIEDHIKMMSTERSGLDHDITIQQHRAETYSIKTTNFFSSESSIVDHANFLNQQQSLSETTSQKTAALIELQIEVCDYLRHFFNVNSH